MSIDTHLNAEEKMILASHLIKQNGKKLPIPDHLSCCEECLIDIWNLYLDAQAVEASFKQQIAPAKVSVAKEGFSFLSGFSNLKQLAPVRGTSSPVFIQAETITLVKQKNTPTLLHILLKEEGGQKTITVQPITSLLETSLYLLINSQVVHVEKINQNDSITFLLPEQSGTLQLSLANTENIFFTMSIENDRS